MELPFNLTPNGLSMALMGLLGVLIAIGFLVLSPLRMFGVGLFLVSFGCVFLGLTNGYHDPTPNGRFMFRISAASFIIGLPVMGWAIYRMV